MTVLQVPALMKGKRCDSYEEAIAEVDRVRKVSGVNPTIVPITSPKGVKYRVMWTL
jgi:pyruvate/oxaloacetate carboxyltransferase